jgi:hypothetical protein
VSIKRRRRRLGQILSGVLKEEEILFLSPNGNLRHESEEDAGAAKHDRKHGLRPSCTV